MLEEIIAVLLRADKVIIPFENLRGAKHVDVIVAAKGNEFSSFDFQDDDMLLPSNLDSTRLVAALSVRRERVELLAPIGIEALVSWTTTETGATAAVHSMAFSGAAGARAELSREGAVYGYSMALISARPTRT